MLHTGDAYEARARQLRAEELSALIRALSRFLFRPGGEKPMSKTERCSRLVHGTAIAAPRQSGCCA
ncbi:RSP_7527 family protein [Roseibium litorale]|uniref:Uncharacterized protein n=1 Tax=Roseibium litorale TaxID=2803841 RepID=A0ABR9CPK3_9HYPH|nr:hypothetical protein [Roseibium litorale]MBD8892789.1 hypothetical protein [Roseibium litorale]